MFRNILNIVLAYKLVEIEGMNEELTLEEWYLKIVEFERARQVIEGIFRRQAIKPLGLVSRIEKANLEDWRMQLANQGLQFHEYQHDEKIRYLVQL